MLKIVDIYILFLSFDRLFIKKIIDNIILFFLIFKDYFFIKKFYYGCWLKYIFKNNIFLGLELKFEGSYWILVFSIILVLFYVFYDSLCYYNILVFSE